MAEDAGLGWVGVGTKKLIAVFFIKSRSFVIISFPKTN